MALATDLNLNLSSSSLPAAIKVDKIPDSFVLTSRTANEAVWTDTNTPVDRPRRVRLAFNPIANVYRGSGIDPGFQYPSKRGVSALIQSTSVASVEDGENTGVRIDLPISLHTVLRFPVTNYLSATDLARCLQAHLTALACYGGTYDPAAALLQLEATLAARIRGSLELDINKDFT